MSVRLSLKEVEGLKDLHRLEKDRRLADRIKAILLLNEGRSYAEISRILLFVDGHPNPAI